MIWEKMYLIQQYWPSGYCTNIFFFLLCFCSSFREKGLDSREQFARFNWNNDYSLLYLLSSTVNFTLKSQMWMCDQWPIVFCDFYGQSLKTEYSISWSSSLNLTQPLACSIPISSPLSGTLSPHFPCPLPILLDSLQEQEAKSGHKWLTEAWGLLSFFFFLLRLYLATL